MNEGVWSVGGMILAEKPLALPLFPRREARPVTSDLQSMWQEAVSGTLSYICP